MKWEKKKKKKNSEWCMSSGRQFSIKLFSIRARTMRTKRNSINVNITMYIQHDKWLWWHWQATVASSPTNKNQNVKYTQKDLGVTQQRTNAYSFQPKFLVRWQVRFFAFVAIAARPKCRFASSMLLKLLAFRIDSQEKEKIPFDWAFKCIVRNEVESNEFNCYELNKDENQRNSSSFSSIDSFHGTAYTRNIENWSK